MFLLILALYFGVLLAISFLTGRNHATDNNSFFLGNRKSPWWIVAIGMVGSSLSGVSFVSVPGWVGSIQFTYMQTVLGFFVGYVVIATLLLPLYYRLQLTSIYSYLGERLGRSAHKTGSAFFLLSKLIGAAVRLYVVAMILQKLVLDAWGVPFTVTVCVLIFLIWLYTFRSGIKTIIWTDMLQTICLLGALVLLIINTLQHIQLPLSEIMEQLSAEGKTRMFVWDDWHSKQHFVKQFFSGIFIAIVMTGLDQDMMQKNLTCKSLKEAKRNMLTYGGSFIPVNLLFLLLGALLLFFGQQQGIEIPAKSDDILPLFATQQLGSTAAILFMIGVIAAAFSSADSALTALTTSFSIDILEIDTTNPTNSKRQRIGVHIAICILFAFTIVLFELLNNTSVIDAVYTIASYTYGPLLGLFSFGLFTKRKPIGKWVPYIALAAPLLCFALQKHAQFHWNYSFGYELLMLNGFITFVCLYGSAFFGKWRQHSSRK